MGTRASQPETAAPPRSASPKLGRFSPILRALFAPPPVSDIAADDCRDCADLEHPPKAAGTPEANSDLLENGFSLDAGLSTLENPPRHANNDGSSHGGSASSSDFETRLRAQYDCFEESSPRPQLLPRGFISALDLSTASSKSSSPSIDAPSSKGSRGDFSPGQPDSLASTPFTSPASTNSVPTVLPEAILLTTKDEPVTPKKVRRKPPKLADFPKSPQLPDSLAASWAAGEFIGATVPLLLNETFASANEEILAFAEQMVSENCTNTNFLTLKNYDRLAKRAHSSVSSLFSQPLWFCPVPLTPLSSPDRLNLADYHPSPGYLFDPNAVRPAYLSTRQAKLDLITARLGMEIAKDRILQEGRVDVSQGGIHVFVDMSNIVINFYNQLKRNRRISPSKRGIYAPPFFFGGLAHVLERGRAVTKRVVVGSTNDAHNRDSWPSYMKDAELLGYETNVLNRVTKPQTHHLQSPGIRRHGGRRLGYSGFNSSDDDGPTFTPAATELLKQGEQAVDELLHLKMCESIIDYEKSTVVLATGDAAEAEFSAGFLVYAEKALARGWNVELVTWQSTISSAWRGLAASGRWGNQFRIVFLDWYVEELFDVR